MKQKLYTVSHDVELLKQIDNGGGQFTAEEHAFLTEKELADSVFRSRETLLRSFLSTESRKLGSLGLLIEILAEGKHGHVISLGAGQCVLEYLLKQSLPEATQVVATDFDSYFIKKASELLPGITATTFDFFKDDVAALKRRVGIDLDVATFFGSAYVMDDQQFIKLFAELRANGVRRVVDFEAEFMDAVQAARFLARPVTGNPIVRRLVGRKPLPSGYEGKFHGYSRSRGEVRRLFHASGCRVEREMATSAYKYVSSLV